jgi:hypothetical protein
MENRIGELALIPDRKADDAGFLNDAGGCIAGGSYDEIGESSALQFGGPFDQGMDIYRKPDFEAGGGGELVHASTVR